MRMSLGVYVSWPCSVRPARNRTSGHSSPGGSWVSVGSRNAASWGGRKGTDSGVARWVSRKQGLEVPKGSAGATAKRPHLLVPPVRSHETRKMSQLQREHLPGAARHAARLHQVAKPALAHSLLSADWLGRLVGGASSSELYWSANTSFSRGGTIHWALETPLIIPASSCRGLVLRTCGCQGVGPTPEVVAPEPPPLAGALLVRWSLLLRWGLSGFALRLTALAAFVSSLGIILLPAKLKA